MNSDKPSWLPSKENQALTMPHIIQTQYGRIGLAMKIVQELFNLSTDMNIADNRGLTPLHYIAALNFSKYNKKISLFFSYI